MKALENQALDIVNAGIGVLKSSQEAVEKALGDATKTINEWKVTAEKAFEDLKVKGALDTSEQAGKARELAVNAARKLS